MAALAPAKPNKPSPERSEPWIEAIVESLRKAVRKREYCTLEVDIYDGNIKRAVMKRSVVRPEDLAGGERRG